MVLPLWPKAGRPAKRVIVHARKGLAAPLRLAPGLILHRPDDRYTAEADAVLRDVFDAYSDTAGGLMAFNHIIMRGPSPFTEGERELIAAYVSGLNACTYCHGVHTATAEAFGIAEGVLTQLLDDVERAPVDDRMKPVLARFDDSLRIGFEMERTDAGIVTVYLPGSLTPSS